MKAGTSRSAGAVSISVPIVPPSTRSPTVTMSLEWGSVSRADPAATS
jgi:hypothetical protein